MTKAELVEKIKAKVGLESKAQAERVLMAAIGEICHALCEDGEISIRDFGTLKVVDRAERTARNPRTGEDIAVPARKVVKFIPSKSLKERVNA